MASIKNGLQIGLIGCGNWGKLILRDLVSLGASVFAVARSDASRKRAEEYGASKIVGNIQDLPKLDGVVIAIPTPANHNILAQLAERHIPVFVEKPMTSSLAEAESLHHMRDYIFVMDKWRYHTGIIKLREIVNNGRIGELQKIQCIRWGWKSKPRQVNAIWYLMPHDLAIVSEILGYLPPVLSARLELYEGVPSGGTAILGRSPWVEISVSERRPNHERIVRVHGDQAMAVLPDSYSKTIDIYDYNGSFTKPEPEQIPISEEMPLKSELAAFLGYLDGGPAPKSNYDSGKDIIEAIERVHELARQ